MNKIVLYCKSYHRDVERVKILLETVVKYNKDEIPFYISCPKSDMNQFRDVLGQSDYILIDDESIYNHGQAEDWTVQQVVKSAFWKMGLCENYLLLDSDSYFIRDFFISDFVTPNGEPYTVMHEQKELFNWTCNKNLGFNPQVSFRECRKKIMDIFGRNGRYYDFGPSPVIWNCAVWRSFSEQYLYPNNLTLSDAIRSVSSEFSWYGEYLLTLDKPIYPCEPIFKVFHYGSQWQEYKALKITEEQIATVYMGVVMQSNANIPMKY